MTQLANRIIASSMVVGIVMGVLVIIWCGCRIAEHMGWFQ